MIIEGAYLRDLLEQPAALLRTGEGLQHADARTCEELARRCHAGEFRCVVLTGMGASFHAVAAVVPRLTTHGILALPIETSELLHHQAALLDVRTLLVVVSQSGRSAEVEALIERCGKRVPAIAITNDAESPLARWATAALVTRAGHEATVSCKTYACTLLALHGLAARLCGQPWPDGDVRPTAHAAAAYLDGWRAHVEELTVALAGLKNLFIVGRGPSLAAAGTAGLIVKEAAGVAAEGMSAAAFRHGPLELVGPGVFVVVLSGEGTSVDLNVRLAADIRSAGGAAAVVGAEPAPGAFALPRARGVFLPILEILPAQMISLALASCAGREAGRFERATKVTTVQ